MRSKIMGQNQEVQALQIVAQTQVTQELRKKVILKLLRVQNQLKIPV